MNNYVKDERVLKNIQEDLANAAIVAGMLLFMKILYDFIRGTARFETTGWFVSLLLVMGIVIYISLYRSKSTQLPTTLLGRPLDTKLSVPAKRTRLYKSYIPESLVGAAALSVGSYLNSGYNGLVPTILLYIFYFIIHLSVTYFWSEHEIKRYNMDLED